MNDEHREGNSTSELSSRTAGGSTATAEPVDRRWFEEALRAQGFLVEPPAVDDEPIWHPAGAPESSAVGGTVDDEPLNIEADEVLGVDTTVGPEAATDELALAEAEAALESAPHAVDAAAEAVPVAEPWDLPPSTQSASTAEPIVTEHAPWPVMGTPTATIRPAAVVTATEQPIAPAKRQAVPPATLPQDVPPVPTPALAARLSRTGGSRNVTMGPPPVRIPLTAPVATTPTVTFEQALPAAPVPPAAEALPAAPVPPAAEALPAAETLPATEAPTIPPDTSVAADRWTLPALQADMAAERAGGAPASVEVQPPPTMTDLAPPVDGSPSTAPIGQADQMAASAWTVAGPVTATPVAITVEPTPAPAEPTPAEPAVALAQATTVSVQPAAPFSPPTTGIAAIARRPTTQTVGTTVDDGESDLWGLVGDPAKPLAAATAAPAASSSRTTALLTVFVAIVVVALVLGFIYLFTSLL